MRMLTMSPVVDLTYAGESGKASLNGDLNVSRAHSVRESVQMDIQTKHE